MGNIIETRLYVPLRITAQAVGKEDKNGNIVGHVVSGQGSSTHYGAIHSEGWRERHNAKPTIIQHKTIDSFCI